MHGGRRAIFRGDGGEPLVVLLGTNEIASAVAARLARSGAQVVMGHDPFPPVIRRGMAFHDALYDDRAEVDGVTGVVAESVIELVDALAKPGRVVVTPLQLTDLITLRTPDVVIDARMQKHRVTPDLRRLTRLAIGLGPNFVAGGNCHVAIETHPAMTGALLASGRTLASDGIARDLGGVGRERFLYAPRSGVWRTALDVGARVYKGIVIGHHDGLPLIAPMDGLLRGVARDSAFAPGDVKLVEIDPRGRAAQFTGTDALGRAIAEAAADAINGARTQRQMRRGEVTVH